MSINKHMIVCCVTDRKLCTDDFLTRMDKIASSVDAVILREKDLPEAEYQELARDVKRIVAKHPPCEFLTHTYSDGESSVRDTKIHVSFETIRDAQGSDLASLFYKEARVGVSVHSMKEAQLAEDYGAGYVIVGNVFETSCKPGVKPCGVKLVKKAVKALDIPVYAIGGITPENVKEVMDCYAQGVCVRSPLMTMPLEEIPKYVRALKSYERD
ncbi:MAG: thiamine phosphate synthase [Clostridia bacterium]|nr:thiamine phosphate synthase [Clostridia bacterium]